MSIPSMESLLKHSVQDLLETIVVSAKVQQSSAVTCAKCIIALVSVSGSEQKARVALKGAKVSECTVKNAMQLVWAYDAVVRPGHADEAWFDALLYVHAVEVRRAIAKVGVEKLAAAKLFATPAKKNLIEFELIADTGMFRAEREAAAQAKADAAIAADAAKSKASTKPEVKAGEGSAEPPKSDAPPATPEQLASIETPKPGKGKKTALDEFDTLITSAEKFVDAVFPTADDLTVETMKNRVAALMVKIDSAAKVRGEEIRKSA